MTTNQVKIQTEYSFGIFHKGILVANTQPVNIEAKEKKLQNTPS